LKGVALVVDLDELAPVGGRATSRRDGRRFERFAKMSQPYQVMISINDTSEALARHGSTVVDVFVNGLCVVSEQPFSLPARPRLSLQTHVVNKGDRGCALVDDFNVSVAED